MGYCLLRGCLYIGERNAAGQFLKVKELHTNEFEVEVTQEMAEHYNSCAAVKVKDLEVVTQSDGKARLVVDTHNAEVLAMALGGVSTAASNDLTFSGVVFPTGLAVGDTVPVPGGFNQLESLTLVDSTGTPVSLVLGTHYSVNLAAGLITILSLTSITQPIKASGQQSEFLEITSIGNDGIKERFIRFDGVDIANGNLPVIVDIYRGSVKPSKSMVKSEGNEFNKYEFEVSLLADQYAPHDDMFGQYGKYVRKTAV